MSSEPNTAVSIATGGLVAEVATRGAELVRLRDAAGRDLLWNGDPAFWTGRSPLLFPIIGQVRHGLLRVAGVDYPIKQHGVARTRDFAVVETRPDGCLLRLEDDAETRRSYPFAFRLDVAYSLAGGTLHLDATVYNPGAAPLPASFGFHPAFRWPLPDGGPRAEHILLFAEDEPGPVHRLDGGLLSPVPHPSPIEGRRLALRDELFADDALIFLAPRSRSVRLLSPRGPAVRVDYPDMPQLGVWTKPGAGFLCIEPWSGYASPQDFEGEFGDKPGVVAIAPGGSHRFGIAITPEAG